MKGEDKFRLDAASEVPVEVFNAMLAMETTPRSYAKVRWENGNVYVRSVPGHAHEAAVNSVDAFIVLHINPITDIDRLGAGRKFVLLHVCSVAKGFHSYFLQEYLATFHLTRKQIRATVQETFCVLLVLVPM